ncbi:MAG: hypothetical protein M1831_006744 [Alyxoria varia]|nr:MAG: hypothetical protein M1831_006744 [Alyxoria varia]
MSSGEQSQTKRSPTPITIITGFLGSGKTTIILNLLPQLPRDYRLALLKNEFGDLAIDSQLASSASIAGVRELLNGCICCNLVGQLGDALLALRSGQVQTDLSTNDAGQDEPTEKPETDTSNGVVAFPATLAMEINRLARENPGAYALDGVISVIDVENWQGYSDSSITAKVQARFTDMIILNKWEAAGERRLDEVLDRLGDLESDTPRIKSSGGLVDKTVFLGVDGSLARGLEESAVDHEHSHSTSTSKPHSSEVEVLSVTLQYDDANDHSMIGLDLGRMEAELLTVAPKDEVYRIKAVLYSSENPRSSDGGGPANLSDQGTELEWYSKFAVSEKLSLEYGVGGLDSEDELLEYLMS